MPCAEEESCGDQVMYMEEKDNPSGAGCVQHRRLKHQERLVGMSAVSCMVTSCEDLHRSHKIASNRAALPKCLSLKMKFTGTAGLDLGPQKCSIWLFCQIRASV